MKLIELIKSLYKQEQCDKTYKTGNGSMCCIRTKNHYGQCKDVLGNWPNEKPLEPR